MNWYLAKLIYRIVCGEGAHTPQFDEQLRLVHANDRLEALQKAQLIGHREQDSFLNTYNKPVQWKFIDVSELYTLDRLTDGAEIYSHIAEENDASAYIKLVRSKASNLLQEGLHHCFQNN